MHASAPQMTYGCYNRLPLQNTVLVQTSWPTFGDRRVVNWIPNTLTKDCQYSKHDKYADPGCVGCKHRFTSATAAPIMNASVTP